jgi:type 1 glutamine amidotransferase
MEYPDLESLEVLLNTNWKGEAHGFAESDWTTGSGEHLVQYLRQLGEGAVLYNTLGHCRGHYDMVPLQDYYPTVERCAWETTEYYELLRRAIRWALGATK